MKIKRTVTTLFMVPTLGISRKSLFDNGFINGFMDYDKKELVYSDDVVYILFKPNNLQLFREFLSDEYDRTDSILEDFNLNETYILVVYKLDPELQRDFLLVESGLYSHTSKQFQTIFPEELVDHSKKVLTKQKSLQFRIFTKDETLLKFWENELDTKLIRTRDLEVWPKFNDEKEILKLKELLDDDRRNN